MSTAKPTVYDGTFFNLVRDGDQIKFVHNSKPDTSNIKILDSSIDPIAMGAVTYMSDDRMKAEFDLILSLI